MTAHAESGNASRVIAQHARTSQLMGVDFVPVYRTTDVQLATSATSAAADAVAQGGATVRSPPSGDARNRAAAEQALSEIKARYEHDAPHKNFVTAFTNIVFGEGDPCARVMFIGEAPGAEEDRTGRPFVGKAGHLLDKMIVAMGLSREDVYIANVLKTRPPNNETPTFEEAQASAPYLFQQIGVIRPEVIVTLGLPATRLILNTQDSMSRMRGRWAEFSHDGLSVPVMPTFHPAFVLRQYTSETRAKVWSDLQQVMTRLGLKSPSKAVTSR